MRTITKLVLSLLLITVIGTAAVAQSAPPAAGANLTIGLVMVGPYNDHGWSQANYDGAEYVVAKVPGTKLVYIDKANSADRPGTTVSQLGESLVAQGAKLVIFSSDDMSDEAVKFAQAQALPFPLLSDPDQALLAALGAWGMKKNYGKEYEGIIRSTFLVDPQGIIRQVWPKVAVKGHVQAVLDQLAALQA